MKEYDIEFKLEELSKLLGSVSEIAINAGTLLSQYFLSGFDIFHKGFYDLVTEADWASEKMITTSLKKLTPKIRIISEEAFSKTRSSANTTYRNCWLVDPLDGTTNFAHKFPHFSISIALLNKNKPILGIVYDPIKKSCFLPLKTVDVF